MKVSREQAAENREKIITAASKLFREKGFDGIGVADLMRTVGLTHGGFYGHFESKDDLIAQACTRSVDDLLAKGEARRNIEGGDPIKAFLENYLSVAHRDNPGDGCLMAALGAEVPRQSPRVKNAFTRNAKRLWAAFTQLMEANRDPEQARQQALVTLATLVGAQVIARAVDDEAISREVLALVLLHVSDSISGN